MVKKIGQRAFQNACDKYRGFCTKCQAFTRGETEPDAEKYPCPKCKGETVMGAEQAMIELVGSELVKRAADRAKRREERLKAQREGREHDEPTEE